MRNFEILLYGFLGTKIFRDLRETGAWYVQALHTRADGCWRGKTSQERSVL